MMRLSISWRRTPSLWLVAGLLSAALPSAVSAQPPPVPPLPTSARSQAPAPYVLQRGDDIEIKARDIPELNATVRIRPDGKISLLLLDDVQAAGLTPAELGQALSAAFARYYREPRISVIVQESAGLSVYVGGEVLKPGLVPLRKPTTALQAVFESGGLKETSRESAVTVLRTDADGNRRTLTLNVQDVLANRQPDIMLQPADIVYVPKSNISVYVGGEVANPGLLPLNGELTAMAAVFQAGGMKETARSDTVILIRNSGSETPTVKTLKLTDVLKGRPDTLLEPFDVLFVPRSRIAKVDKFVDQYIRQLIPITVTTGFTYLLGGSAAVVR